MYDITYVEPKKFSKQMNNTKRSRLTDKRNKLMDTSMEWEWEVQTIGYKIDSRMYCTT